METKAVTLKNPRTGEIWICDNFSNRRTIDGNIFVEVHKQHAERPVWIALSALVRVKSTDTSSVGG